MNRVQQQFWKNRTDYQIVGNNGVIVENLKIEEVLRYCIENGMVPSISFLIGENDDTKEIYKSILKQLNII